MSTILVGNGPSAVKNKLGCIIDGFDRVIRFNRFITKCYEEFVGCRTDIWVINSGIFLNLEDVWKENADIPRPATYVLTAKTTNPEITPTYNQIKQMPFPPNTYLGREKIAKQVDRYGDGVNYWVSTGIIAMLEFQPCHIVGFDCFLEKNHHYFGGTGSNMYHQSRVESALIQKLIEKDRVRLLTSKTNRV